MSAIKWPARSGAGEENFEHAQSYPKSASIASATWRGFSERRRTYWLLLLNYVWRNGFKVMLTPDALRKLWREEHLNSTAVRQAADDLRAIGLARTRMAGGFEVIELTAFATNVVPQGGGCQ